MKKQKLLLAGLVSALLVYAATTAYAGGREGGLYDITGCFKEDSCALFRFPDTFTEEYVNYRHVGIEFCLDKGIMNGTSENTFSPGAKLTRAQLATMLYRYDGSPEVNAANPFTDLTEDWYKTSVAWAASVGIVNGTSATTFSPYEPISNEQLATIFYRYAKSKGLNTELDGSVQTLISDPSDPYSDYAKDAILWGNQANVIDLCDVSWNDNDGMQITAKNAGKFATRFDTAYYFYRLYTTLTGEYYTPREPSADAL